MNFEVMKVTQLRTLPHLFLVMVLLSGCGHALNPQAKAFLQQAKGETGVNTALTLVEMMETSLQQAILEIGESAGLTMLHDQFHALRHALSKVSETQARAASYDEAITIQKEMKTVFHRLWEYKNAPIRRKLHLDLFDNRLNELRQALQNI